MFKIWFDDLTEIIFEGMSETERYRHAIKMNTDHKVVWLKIGKSK